MQSKSNTPQTLSFVVTLKNTSDSTLLDKLQAAIQGAGIELISIKPLNIKYSKTSPGIFPRKTSPGIFPCQFDNGRLDQADAQSRLLPPPEPKGFRG